MEQKKKYQHNGGRKPKLDPRTHRYSFNLDDVENAKFLSFFDRSGYTIKAHFIKNCIFGKSFKVTVRDKSKVDYYIQLTQFYSQFRSIGAELQSGSERTSFQFFRKESTCFTLQTGTMYIGTDKDQ